MYHYNVIKTTFEKKKIYVSSNSFIVFRAKEVANHKVFA